jgi:hypothetical protein
MSKLSRRKFVADVGLTGAGLAIVPRHVLGKGLVAPSDRLSVACVGVGGQGRANLVNLVSQNIVALCDVDWDYAGQALAPAARSRAGRAGRQPRLRSPRWRRRACERRSTA